MNAADLCVYPTLAVATSLYALALDDNKQHAPADQKIEPDWTWIEVAIGTGMCLLAAAVRARLEPVEPDWHTYEGIVRNAFKWGGTPIVIWQIWRAIERHKRRGNTLQNLEKHYADRERPTATVASLRRPGAPANGTDG